MTALELADAMEIRASIRKKATNRKSVQENANDRLADQLTQAATMLRQQQAEIEDLKNANRFIQNFAEEQHQRAVGLESELDRAVELYTDKAIENEALLKFIDERGETGQLIIWKAQEK